MSTQGPIRKPGGTLRQIVFGGPLMDNICKNMNYPRKKWKIATLVNSWGPGLFRGSRFFHAIIKPCQYLYQSLVVNLVLRIIQFLIKLDDTTPNRLQRRTKNILKICLFNWIIESLSLWKVMQLHTVSESSRKVKVKDALPISCV